MTILSVRLGAALAAVAIASGACSGGTGFTANVWPFPGGQYKFDILPEMHYQQSYRQQEPRRLYPAEGSVPIVGREIAPSDSEARALRNPISAAQNADGGKKLFETNCIFCHGEKGDGNGRAKAFFEAYKGRLPANLTDADIKAQSDGEIYATLIKGKNYNPSGTLNGMPPFGQILSSEERWLLVNYVRKLQSGG